MKKYKKANILSLDKFAQKNNWVKVNDKFSQKEWLVDPEFKNDVGCLVVFKGKCSHCGKEYEGGGTCLWCQKGKMIPID